MSEVLQHSLQRGVTIPPPGALILQYKYCEICGRPFVRRFAPTSPIEQKEWTDIVVAPGCGYGGLRVEVTRRRDHGARFCKDCRGRQLEPDVEAQEQYRAQLPDEREGKKRRVYDMPDYRSLNPPVGRQTQSHAINKRAGRPLGFTRAELLKRANETRVAVNWAFSMKPQLTAEELQELIPGCYQLSDIHPRLQGLHINVKLVGRVRQEGMRGAGFGVYELASIN